MRLAIHNSVEEMLADATRIGPAAPSLKFVLHDVLVGTDAITLYYYNVTRGRMVAEILTVNDQHQVISGSAHYAAKPS